VTHGSAVLNYSGVIAEKPPAQRRDSRGEVNNLSRLCSGTVPHGSPSSSQRQSLSAERLCSLANGNLKDAKARRYKVFHPYKLEHRRVVSTSPYIQIATGAGYSPKSMSNHGDQAHGSDTHHAHPAQPPYWKRAHRDWRLWAGMLLAMACMIYYVMSIDLAWKPRAQPPQSNAAGK
jgi:hypothetical protein